MMPNEFKLRAWIKEDIKSLSKHANNPDIAKNMTDKFPHPYTEADAEAFIGWASDNRSSYIFAIEVNGEAVGGIGIHPQDDIHRNNAELGYWLSEALWGNGIITLAIKEVVDFAFTSLEVNRVFARPFSTNLASQKVLEKNGFRLEARLENILIKNGEVMDELIYAIRKEKRMI